jgi:hypothetical protein
VRKLPAFLLILTVGLGVARAALLLADGAGPDSFAGVAEPEPRLVAALWHLVIVAGFAAIGAFVAARRPRNPIGWLLIAAAFAFALGYFAERLGWHLLLADRTASDRVAFWLWLADWPWFGAVVSIFIGIPLLFPSGRPDTTRTRRLLWATAALAGVSLFALTLAPGPLLNYPAVENPFGTAAFVRVLRVICTALILPAALLSAGSLALRFRRSRGDLYFAAFLAIPAAVAVAILRYRLYDIDVVINRALVYGTLTATLALVYLASVLALQLALTPITSDSGPAVAVSTLAVAGLFGPVRARIQALVDRRFYRRRYDAARTLEAFSLRLREEIDLDSLMGELAGAVNQTVQPEHVSIWLRTRA